MFRLIRTHSSGARYGELQTVHGTLRTPFFMPIATKGAVKTLSAPELFSLERDIDNETTPIVLSNTYHLYLKPGLALLRQAGGVAPFMHWPAGGAMLTDSGGFQIFSLSHLRTITEEGVNFRSHIDGSMHHISPEFSMEIQSVIGADIWMAFDYFPGYPAAPEDVEHSVQLTTRWAKRCRAWVDSYREGQGATTQKLFGIVQGSTIAKLREQSAKELVALDFDGYAIGGLAVGEPAEEMYRVLESTVPHIPSDRPRYLMGVGFPEQILEAVKRGVDMFDCVLPTRNARHGSLFVHRIGHESIVANDLSEVQYERINIKSDKYSKDFNPIDRACLCSTCTSGFSRAYIRHLFSVNEPLAARLATIHNLTFYLQLMKEIRDTITHI
ncbi:MAG: tRNA guanosine(34) transglycosylase Tgt [Candidatus Kerfeldbacteria bacterium]|nr:tRNA guanosine(34) transglycosylase Tgt [Candidatus Kerfeldbacteria bacterium]